MSNFDGFNHNFQALKILTLLEKKYIGFDGLNLTFETLDGILKHNGPINCKVPFFVEDFIRFFNGDLKANGSFESQIAAICDDIAYNNNDIDDGLYANFFKIEELEQLNLVKKVLETIEIKKKDTNRLKYEIVRKLIKFMVDDLINNTKANIKKYKISSLNDVTNIRESIVCFSKKMTENELSLKNFLKSKMYMHPKIRTMTIKAKKIVSDLFDLYVKEPDLLPKEWNSFSNKKEKFVVVCDYISGMTDKYATNTHKKFLIFIIFKCCTKNS